MNFELVCERGPMKGCRWSITPEGLKIGRAESCEIRIEEVAVELFHCAVKLVDGKPVVQNLASDRGVNLNGSRVFEAQLNPMDVICVGCNWFVVAAPGDDKCGSGARIAAVAVVLLLAVVAFGMIIWKRGRKSMDVAQPPITTNAATHVEAPVTTNRVVRIVGEEIVVTNRIIHVVDNVVVTNYVVEVKPADKPPTEAEPQGDNVAKTEGDNENVAPGAADGLGLSDDGKTLMSVPQGIAHIVIPNGVTTIGDMAFENHKALESVMIPPSVTKFGRNAFRGCNKFTGVMINDLAAWCQLSFAFDDEGFGCAFDNPLWHAHNLYLNGALVKDMKIPPEVTRIGNSAFRGCCSITKVTIPKRVKEICPGAFGDCGNLVKFEVDAANRYYKSVDGLLLTKDGSTLVSVPGGLDNVKIPNGVLNIGDRAFAGCKKLSKLTIPDGVTNIGYRAFRDCSGLIDVQYPPSMAKISSFAFDGCKSLANIYITDLTAWCRISVAGFSAPLGNARNLYLNGKLVNDMRIPVDVARIEGHVFKGCASLTRVTIPQGVEHIGEGAFADCSNLIEFRVAGSNYHYKDDRGLLMTRDGKTLLAVPGGMPSVEIPGGTEVIAAHALNGCRRLVDVKIPDGVTRVGGAAFADCKELARVDIPNSVKIFWGWGVFSGCDKLSSITIPGSLERIGSGAFAWDWSLKNVVIQNGVKRYAIGLLHVVQLKALRFRIVSRVSRFGRLQVVGN